MLLFRFQMRLLHILRRKGTTFFLYTQEKSAEKVRIGIKIAKKFAHIKKKQYFCTRFCKSVINATKSG